MNQKMIKYISVVIIGMGFIVMSISNVLHNEYASIIQGVLGTIFIVIAIIKIATEQK